MKITKVVIPAAGLGTRFLPWTKAMPKEMLPIVDKPVIQYIVEECVEAGIEDIIVVTSWHKRAIEDHFDYLPELEHWLKKQGKLKALEQVKKLNQMANFIFVRQKGSYGNATPVLSSRKAVGNEPFAVVWGDQFIWSKPSRMKQCLKVFNKYQKPVMAGVRVPKEKIPFTGIGRTKRIDENLFQLLEIVEKPSIENSPSNLAVTGAYFFFPDIFPLLQGLKPGKDGELWLVDAINELCRRQQVLTLDLKGGILYDAGNKLNYHKTVVDFMLKDKEIGLEMKKYLQEKLP